MPNQNHLESPGHALKMQWIGIIVLSALVGAGATLGTQAVFGMASSTTPSTSALASAADSTNISQVVQRVEPDVVAIVNYTRSASGPLKEQGVGTGVYFLHDPNAAYIITNNHVVAGASQIDVILATGAHVAASVVGTDPYTDLAVVKIPASAFQATSPARFGNSNDILAGQTAIVIGTPMGLNFADSVTAGIISSVTRMMPVSVPQDPQQVFDYQPVIQTDAAINPGNSGGPLIDGQGAVIGIVSSKITAPNFDSMGFAIPANIVNKIAVDIIQTGHAVHSALGISGQSLASTVQSYPSHVPVDYGVYVTHVVSAEARAAGLQPQDIIVAVNGKTVRGLAELRTTLFQYRPGDAITLQVYHGDQKRILKITLGSMGNEGQPNTADA